MESPRYRRPIPLRLTQHLQIRRVLNRVGPVPAELNERGFGIQCQNGHFKW